MLLGLLPPPKDFTCLKKNLYCQTFTSRLYNLNYNLDYIIYKLKQTDPNSMVN
jgi:hypothetical protein